MPGVPDLLKQIQQGRKVSRCACFVSSSQIDLLTPSKSKPKIVLVVEYFPSGYWIFFSEIELLK
jgi:hypothetical protein